MNIVTVVGLIIATAISAIIATINTKTSGAWWWVFGVWMLAHIITGVTVWSIYNSMLRNQDGGLPLWFAGVFIVAALWMAGTASFNGF